MRAVYKYKIPFTDGTDRASKPVLMPGGAKILCVGLQPNSLSIDLCIWAEVNTDVKEIPRVFYMFGMEPPPPITKRGIRYIGTIFPQDCVFHVYIQD